MQFLWIGSYPQKFSPFEICNLALLEYYKCIKDPKEAKISLLGILDGGNPQKNFPLKKSISIVDIPYLSVLKSYCIWEPIAIFGRSRMLTMFTAMFEWFLCQLHPFLFAIGSLMSWYGVLY